VAYWSPFPKSMTVAERKALAAGEVAARKKSGVTMAPVVIEGRTIATTFWGRSWCDNLERYRDFANRLERGRSYVRSGAVIDLRIGRGKIEALVSGSSVYRVSIDIDKLDAARWQALKESCSGSIASLLALLQGKLDAAVMTQMCDQNTGLFPTPQQIEFACSCPDIAYMCKHVAAVLYGVGARLDKSPELMFTLRAVDPAELVTSAGTAGSRAGRKRSSRALDPDSDLAALFGLELDELPVIEVASRAPKAKASPKPAAKAATKVPAKAATKVPAKAATKVPAKAAAKVPAKAAAKVPAKVPAKLPAKAAWKVPATRKGAATKARRFS